MKAIAQDPLLPKISGKSIYLRNPGHVPMKGCIETGDLGHLRI